LAFATDTLISFSKTPGHERGSPCSCYDLKTCSTCSPHQIQWLTDLQKQDALQLLRASSVTPALSRPRSLDGRGWVAILPFNSEPSPQLWLSL
jgi:hypothetical protein